MKKMYLPPLATSSDAIRETLGDMVPGRFVEIVQTSVVPIGFGL